MAVAAGAAAGGPNAQQAQASPMRLILQMGVFYLMFQMFRGGGGAAKQEGAAGSAAQNVVATPTPTPEIGRAHV